MRLWSRRSLRRLPVLVLVAVALGLGAGALDPHFPTPPHIYLYLTTERDNRVVRYTLSGSEGLREPMVVLDGIPRAAFHNGGRIELGPDGRLWVTTGDAGVSSRAQETDDLGGKILRVEPGGSIPEDNPGPSPIWSLGHRNPQGLAWDDAGAVWSTEHGRSGFTSGMDELNRVARGGNHGWLYLATGNRDGRGSVRDGDDRIVKIDPRVFDANSTSGRVP